MPAKTSPAASPRNGRRVTGKEREKTGRKAVALYDTQGLSVREVRDEIGWSYGATHRLLLEFGAQMRGRGSGNRKRR